MIRVVIVDDDDLMRAGITMIVHQTEDIEVVGEAVNGRDAVTVVAGSRPDVVLMDVRMPRMDGITATARIIEAPEPPKVIVLTTFELDEYVFEALEAGASGFLLKRTPPEQLIQAIRVVVDEGSILSPSVTRRLIAEFTSKRRPESVPGIDDLTDREMEVLSAIARGLSNDELAAELFIGANTVKTHVRRILSKLGARDRTQAVVLAYRSGLMD